MTQDAGAYQLIDFGHARKLESLGGYVVDRPSPAAEFDMPEDRRRWHDADARFDSGSRRWEFRRPWPESLVIDCDGFRMPARPTPFGHIGLFPEQSDNWQWLRQHSGNESEPKNDKALNLFGYTGASTMALVSGGFGVAHVDAAKPNVDAARRAAAANDWQDRPIRYLIDDAGKFAAREVRRKRKYHTIVLDPPAYGHSPKGSGGKAKTWRLERDLWPLLDDCLRLLDLTAQTEPRLLVTGHTETIGAEEVIQYIRSSRLIDAAGLQFDAARSQLMTPSGRSLDAGFYVRCNFGKQ